MHMFGHFFAIESQLESKEQYPKLKDNPDLFYIPPDVDVDALQSNGNLFDARYLQAIEDGLSCFREGRYSKSMFDVAYGINKGANTIYGIYRDNKLDQQYELGFGVFGTSKLIHDEKNNIWYVMKTESLSSEFVADQYLNEYRSLKILGLAPELYRIRERPFKGDKVNIIMQHAAGISLADFIELRNLSETNESKFPKLILLELVIGLLKRAKQIYDAGIIHRDLKPEHVIIDFARGKLAIIDFGHSIQRKKNADGNFEAEVCASVVYGTPGYFDSTAFTNEYGIYSDREDLYSLSYIIEKLLFNKKYDDQIQFVSAGNALSFDTDREISNFIKKMRAKEDRPNFAKAIKFFEDYRQKYLQQHPNDLAIVTKVLQQMIDEEQQRLQKAHEKLKSKANPTESLAAMSTRTASYGFASNTGLFSTRSASAPLLTPSPPDSLWKSIFSCCLGR